MSAPSEAPAAPAAPAAAAAAAPTAALAGVHAQIRRGSVLRTAPKSALEAASSLPALAVTAYNQRASAEQNEARLLQELSAKRGSIVLRPVAVARTEANNAERARQAYLAEQADEAALLAQNAEVLQALRVPEDIPPPPPSEEAAPGDDIPPPPSSAPPAAFLDELANPKLKLGLQPVANPKAIYDGINPALAVLSTIEKRRESVVAGLRKAPRPEEKNYFASESFKAEYAKDEAELDSALRANTALLDSLKLSAPPAYPEAEEDLREAEEAKRAEEELLKSVPVEAAPDMPAAALAGQGPASAVAAAPKLAQARRNSKMAYLGDLQRPLARVALKPVVTEEKSIAEIVAAVKQGEAIKEESEVSQ